MNSRSNAIDTIHLPDGVHYMTGLRVFQENACDPQNDNDIVIDMISID